MLSKKRSPMGSSAGKGLPVMGAWPPVGDAGGSMSLDSWGSCIRSDQPHGADFPPVNIYPHRKTPVDGHYEALGGHCCRQGKKKPPAG